MEEAEDSRDAARDRDAVYPVFRKLKGRQHYYRIDAPDRFSEVHFIGGRPVFHEVDGRAYPERLRIAEMIAGDDGRYVPISPAEWDALSRRK